MTKVGGEAVSRRAVFLLVLALALVTAPDVRAACDCSATPGSYAWLANTKIRFNNDAVIIGNVGANLPGGLVRFGRNSCQGSNEASPCTGNSVAVSADKLVVGQGSSIAGSESNHLKLGAGSTVRNPPLLSVTLPLVSADSALICGAFAPIACGGADVIVPAGSNLVALAPGSYGNLLMGNGSTITFQAGSYTFCAVKIGSNVVGNVDGATVLNVSGKFSMGSGTTLETAGPTPFVLNSAGALVRISQGSILEAEVRAPFGKVKQQRNATILGCSCSNAMTSDKHHANVCEAGGGAGSPSGAFID